MAKSKRDKQHRENQQQVSKQAQQSLQERAQVEVGESLTGSQTQHFSQQMRSKPKQKPNQP